ncbi:unnamed protein product [Microthlaspi erraticum]|uniref:F-box domain-containing protein n=1 Tax=Microthlaspi erraticum TaxID=1685480 RepID=A0A6D2IM45_9BRAS|nr:unnamed protein product [Microthlaspi erraticum]
MLSSSTNLGTVKNCKESSSQLNMSYIPDDILLNCLARVSRFYYPTLSLVSKRFRSLLASPELYKTRTLLSRTETCLYVYLCHRWFTLCRRPTKSRRFTLSCFRPSRTLTSDNILVSVPSRNDFPYYCQTLTAVGSSIYMIGGYTAYIHNKDSPRVFFMDCRSHTWHEAPSMQIVPNNPRASVIDGKIYVVEGSSRDLFGSLKYSIAVFDPKTQTWELVESPGAGIRGAYISNSLVTKENIYFFGDKSLVYKPSEKIWEAVGLEMHLLHMNLWLDEIPDDGYCEIDNVLYCYRLKKVLEWYDYEEGAWKVLKGLEKLPKLPTGKNRVSLIQCGKGKIAVLWDKKHAFSSETRIWCAEILLERRSKYEIYGRVEWCDVVLTVPRSRFFRKQLISATV